MRLGRIEPQARYARLRRATAKIRRRRRLGFAGAFTCVRPFPPFAAFNQRVCPEPVAQSVTDHPTERRNHKANIRPASNHRARGRNKAVQGNGGGRPAEVAAGAPQPGGENIDCRNNRHSQPNGCASNSAPFCLTRAPRVQTPEEGACRRQAAVDLGTEPALPESAAKPAPLPAASVPRALEPAPQQRLIPGTRARSAASVRIERYE
jgi:hypothetical protein